MKKKNGFVFIETIITIVFLAASLLLLFSSYQNAIVDEKNRVYYDDISYLYRNYYLADFLINKTEITKKEEEMFANKYIYDVQSVVENESKNSDLYSTDQENENYPAELKKLVEEFNVNNMLVVSDKIITECYNGNNENCTKSYNNINPDLANYIKAMKIDSPEEGEEKQTEYYLVTEYREKDTDEGITKCDETTENCSSFYVTLKLDIATGIKKGNTIAEVCEGQQFGECIEDNYDIENNDKSGIYYHDGVADYENMPNSELEAKDYSYRYAGDANNYICFGADKCSDRENTENLYRIIGSFNGSLKIIKAEKETNYKWNSGLDNNITWEKSTLNKYLNNENNEYLKPFVANNWANIIVDGKWNAGPIGNDLNKNAQEMFTSEATTENLTGKVGLINASDYMYAALPSFWSTPASNYQASKEENWLNIGENEWLITKIINESTSLKVLNTGKISTSGITSSLSVRPVINLENTVILGGGTGTIDDPYLIDNAKPYITSHEATTTVDKITINPILVDGGPKIKYYFYKIAGQDYVKTEQNKYTFNNLKDNTEYTITMKVQATNGYYSNEYVAKVKTNYKEPKVTLKVDSFTDSTIVVKATGEKGSTNISKFEYSTDNKTWKSNNSTANPNSYTFTGLASNKSYTLYVRMTDAGGHTATDDATATTSYKEPKVALSITSATANSITVSATGTAGSSNISKFEYSMDNKTWKSSNSTANPNSYTFKSLNISSNYTLYVKMTDASGHTATANVKYTNPVANSVSVSSTSWNSLTVNVSATKKTTNLGTYYCSNNNGNTYSVTSKNGVCTFNNLDSGKTYNIRAYVLDANGRKSNEVTTTGTTGSYIYPSVYISSTSSTSNSITVNATGSAGTGNLSQYYYAIYLGGTFVSSYYDNVGSSSSSHTFDYLVENTTYTVQVKVYDENGKSSTIASADVTTKQDKPTWPPLHTINGKTAIVTKDGYGYSGSHHAWEIISIGVKNIVRNGNSVTFDYGIRFENPDSVDYNGETYTGQHVGNAMGVIYNRTGYYAHKGGSSCGTADLESENYYGTVYYATNTTKEDHKGICTTFEKWGYEHSECDDNPEFVNITPFSFSGTVNADGTVKVNVTVSWSRCSLSSDSSSTNVTFVVSV